MVGGYGVGGCDVDFRSFIFSQRGFGYLGVSSCSYLFHVGHHILLGVCIYSFFRQLVSRMFLFLRLGMPLCYRMLLGFVRLYVGWVFIRRMVFRVRTCCFMGSHIGVRTQVYPLQFLNSPSSQLVECRARLLRVASSNPSGSIFKLRSQRLTFPDSQKIDIPRLNLLLRLGEAREKGRIVKIVGVVEIVRIVRVVKVRMVEIVKILKAVTMMRIVKR